MHMLPNALTASRIAASLCLLVCIPFSAAWYALYAWCVISDVLDGLLARRMGVATSNGARFDSAADTVLAFSIAASCAFVLPWQVWMVVWVAIILAVRTAALTVCRIRFGIFSFLHTWANKATGIMLFAMIAALPLAGMQSAAIICCLCATLSSAEELVLMVRMPVFDADCRGMGSLFS